MTTNFLTKEGFQRLQEELDHLRTTKRLEVAARLHEAMEGGELIENAEYEAWDRNGMPLNLAVQRPIWLKCEPSSSAARPGELRQAIINYATISDVQLGAEESTSLECEALFRRVAEEHARR